MERVLSFAKHGGKMSEPAAQFPDWVQWVIAAAGAVGLREVASKLVDQWRSGRAADVNSEEKDKQYLRDLVGNFMGDMKTAITSAEARAAEAVSRASDAVAESASLRAEVGVLRSEVDRLSRENEALRKTNNELLVELELLRKSRQ